MSIEQVKEINENEELKKNILKQIEYYFSMNNLLNDSYLVSIMDEEYYVPLTTIFNFKRVKQLTTDTNLILETIKPSSSLVFDKEFTKVKPSFNFQRRILLVQGIPLNADINEVAKLFEHGYPVSLSPDFSGTWIAKFYNEKDAIQNFELVSSKTYNNKKLRVKILIEQSYPKKKNYTKVHSTSNLNGNSNTNTNTTGNGTKKEFQKKNEKKKVKPNFDNEQVFPKLSSTNEQVKNENGEEEKEESFAQAALKAKNIQEAKMKEESTTTVTGSTSTTTGTVTGTIIESKQEEKKNVKEEEEKKVEKKKFHDKKKFNKKHGTTKDKKKEKNFTPKTNQENGKKTNGNINGNSKFTKKSTKQDVKKVEKKNVEAPKDSSKTTQTTGDSSNQGTTWASVVTQE
eukprot:gene9374-1585_t